METLIGILFTATLTVVGLLFAMKVVTYEDKKELSPEELAVYEKEISSENVNHVVDAAIQHAMGNGAEPVCILIRKGQS